MKLLKVTLRQTPEGSFQVEKFSNTAQLSIGQIIAHATVAEWCTRPRIQVDVIGMIEQADEQELLTEATPTRHDALQLAGNHDENNPF